MDQSMESILNVSIWGLAKVFVIFALFIYLVFAIVVVRQVHMMIKVVSGELNLPIKIAAWLHLVLAIFIIFLSVAIL